MSRILGIVLLTADTVRGNDIFKTCKCLLYIVVILQYLFEIFWNISKKNFVEQISWIFGLTFYIVSHFWCFLRLLILLLCLATTRIALKTY